MPGLAQLPDHVAADIAGAAGDEDAGAGFVAACFLHGGIIASDVIAIDALSFASAADQPVDVKRLSVSAWRRCLRDPGKLHFLPRLRLYATCPDPA